MLLAFLPLCSPSQAEGYRFDAVYTGEVFSNVSGGIETGTRYLDNLDLKLEVDIAEAWGFASGRFFVYGLYNNATTLSDELVGDLQGINNIDAPHAWRVYEFWYEFGDGPWSIRTGLYDLNSEFDTIDAGGLFLNSSHGIGPDFSQTDENGPGIFPISSLALRGSLRTNAFTVRIAVLDGVPDNPASNAIDIGGQDGTLTVAELDVPIFESGRLWAGHWRYSGDFERPFDAGTTNDNDGWYIGAENRFVIGSHSAAWFVRFGSANEQLYPVQDYVGAGIVIDAPVATRPDDQLGFAVASARVGDPYRTYVNQIGGNAQRRETNWELTYRAQLSERLAIQPDIQFVQYPAASSSLDNAWVVGLRFEIAY